MAYTGFKKLEGELSHEKGVRDPAALSAYLGRRKYGVKKFNAAAAKGKKMRGVKPKGY